MTSGHHSREIEDLVSQKDEALRECVQAQAELSELKKRVDETRQEAERMVTERDLHVKNRQLLEELIQATEAKSTAIRYKMVTNEVRLRRMRHLAESKRYSPHGALGSPSLREFYERTNEDRERARKAPGNAEQRKTEEELRREREAVNNYRAQLEAVEKELRPLNKKVAGHKELPFAAFVVEMAKARAESLKIRVDLEAEIRLNEELKRTMEESTVSPDAVNDDSSISSGRIRRILAGEASMTDDDNNSTEGAPFSLAAHLARMERSEREDSVESPPQTGDAPNVLYSVSSGSEHFNTDFLNAPFLDRSEDRVSSASDENKQFF